MNMIMKYLLFFIANCVLTYYIFPEPSYAKSILYSALMTIFVAINYRASTDEGFAARRLAERSDSDEQILSTVLQE